MYMMHVVVVVSGVVGYDPLVLTIINHQQTIFTNITLTMLLRCLSMRLSWWDNSTAKDGVDGPSDRGVNVKLPKWVLLSILPGMV